MRTARPALSLLASAVLLASPLPAQQVIDQSQPVTNYAFANLISGWSGQSFVQSGANVSGIGIFLQGIYGYDVTGPVELRLFDRVPNGSNNPVLLKSASQTATVGNAGSWVDFYFDPIDIVPGSSLFLAVSGSPSIGYLQTHAGYSSTGSIYTDGQGYLAISLDPTAAYNPNSTYDLAFRSYTTLVQAITTPEPASAVLFATGLFGIAGVVRRRRATH